MKILYVGDITGKLGRKTAESVLPKLIEERQIDFVIAQSENVTHGKGLRSDHHTQLMENGIHFFTGGNHSLALPELYNQNTANITRPANLKEQVPGRGWQLADTPFGKVLVISLLGQIVGMAPEIENPLAAVDVILEENKNVARAATIVNFHGDFSSEKIVIGQYLDGRVTAVIGDHWHVPTADAQVLPGGTAHITDVGMVGALDSSLGVKTDVIVQRWLSGKPSRNEMEDSGRRQFNAVLIDTDIKTGLAKSIDYIREVIVL
jgi:metallophosphoesterase (TIGR00282 family)